MKAREKHIEKTTRSEHNRTMTIRTHTEARTQYLYIVQNRKSIAAARYQLTPARYSPWLITHGKEHLPQNPIVRGKYLTKIFNEA